MKIRLVRTGPRPFAAETITDAAGRFRFIGLTWGRYSLDFALAGWQSKQLSEMDLPSISSQAARVVLQPVGKAQGPEASQILPEDLWWGTQLTGRETEKLPNGRNLWSILGREEPSIVTGRLEIDSVEVGAPMLYGTLGASWTENQYRLNGAMMTDPYVPGLPLIDPDIDALAEFQVVSAAKPAIFSASGTTVSLEAPRPQEDQLHGSMRVFYSGRALQSDNLNARLSRFDFPGPERMNNLEDASAQLGGKLPARLASLPFFVALSTQQLSKDLGGFAAPIDAHVYRGLVEFVPISRASQQLTLLYSGQHVLDSRAGAAPAVAPSATTRANRNFHQFQARWDRFVKGGTVLDASFTVVNAIVSSDMQTGVSGISTIDLPEMVLTGPAPLARAGLRTRYQGRIGGQTLTNHPAGAHSLSFGLDWDRSDISNRSDSAGGMEQILVDGVGSDVIRWNTPTLARQHVQNVAEYIQDAWRPTRWLALLIGLRVDTSTGRAVGQPTGISWTTLQPRAGLLAPLKLLGLSLQASWSRYGHLLQGRYLDFGNPAALSGQLLRWQDTNGDGVAQPQELGPVLRVFGGSYSAISPRLERPFTDEISVGLVEQIGGGLRASVRFFRRDDHRLIGINNVGVPFSDYTPVQVVDPGNGEVLTLYNRDPSALGRDFLVLTNPGLHASFKGFEIRLNKRLLPSWDFSASFTASHAFAPTSPGNSPFQDDTGFVGSLGTDPNTLINAQGRTYFDRGFIGKFTSYYSAPGGFHIGAVFPYYDGAPFGRLLFVNGFNQGPFFARATPVGHPGGFQTQLNSTLDLRVSRDFGLKTGVLSGYVDVFNVMNVNSNTQESALTGPTFLSRVPLAVEPPRTARIGLRWAF